MTQQSLTPTVRQVSHMALAIKRVDTQHSREVLTPQQKHIEGLYTTLLELHPHWGDKDFWIGFDFDATLFHYDYFRGQEHIGAPIPAGIQLLKDFLSAGFKCKIFTARVCEEAFKKNNCLSIEELRSNVQAAVFEQTGHVLEVTNVKTYTCLAIIDDRAVQITRNVGTLTDPDALAKAIIHG